MIHLPIQSPPVCGLCLHTIREGESYEPRMWERDSGPAMPAVAHVPACPPQTGALAVLPCPPCLRARLTGQPDDPHRCQLESTAGIDGHWLVIVPARECPCPCSRRREPESAALRAARAEARERVSADGSDGADAPTG